MAKIKSIVQVDIKDLKPYENNAKKHSEKQIDRLANSIKEFGFISPVLIDNNNNVIAGHGRLMAAKAADISKVPCLKVEGLTDEQRRAYILADNRLCEMGSWDSEVLVAELSQLNAEDFQLDLTGFELDDIDKLQEKLEQPYGAERNRTTNTYNMDSLYATDLTDDFWQMPVIKNDGFVPDDLIGFNFAKTSKEKNVGIHFFVDDYQFERVWNAPEKYVEVLRDYQCILSPDFSLYMDMPMPMKIWNIYRSRFIGAFYQSYGIKVIPTISWAEEETFRFCFQGIPEGSIVAVSTVGVKEQESAFQVWTQGMKAMIETIKPAQILVYGGQLDFDYGDIKVIPFENKVLKEWKGNDKN